MMNRNGSNLENGVEIPHSEIRIPQSAESTPHSALRIPQSNALRILLLEDSPVDAELNERALRRDGMEFESLRVDTLNGFVAALYGFRPDAILADYKLPGFDGLQALAIARERSPEVPYIFVTGAMGEELAAAAIRQGADDYILKDRPARLPSAVRHAIEERQAKRQQHESEEKFRKISEAAQDAIIMMDADRRVSFWNEAAVRIFGYAAAEAVGQELHALITPAAACARFIENFPHFQKTGEGALIGKVTEVTALRKGGAEFPVELSISSTRFGAQWHAIAIVRDITRRRQAEAMIAGQLDELRRWHEATVGRELRVIEVKHEVNELLAQLGQPPRYPSAEYRFDEGDGSAST